MALTKRVPRITRPTSAYKLLDRVCEVIAEEPRRYVQTTWMRLAKDYESYPDMKFPACGTVCCVAGWVETLRSSPLRVAKLSQEWKPGGVPAGVVAQETLGITEDEAGFLFDGDAISLLCERLGIPEPDQGTRAYARLGVKHIRAFQKAHADKLKKKIVRPVLAHPAVREGR